MTPPCMFFCILIVFVHFCRQLLPEQRGDSHQPYPEWIESDGEPPRLCFICAGHLTQRHGPLVLFPPWTAKPCLHQPLLGRCLIHMDVCEGPESEL